MKRIIAGIFILFISFHGNASAKQTEDMGFVLLDRVLFKFKELGRSGAIDSKPLHDLLDECYKKAKKAKGEDTIDLIFFNRYQKLLIAIRLATSKDSTEMLEPILIKTINGFETTDESNRLTKSMSKSKKIYLISGAIIREMTDLRLYLEKNAHRSQLFKKTMLLGNLFQGKNKNIWYVKGNKKPFSGVAIAKYSDGTLKEKTNFKNGIMEGSRFLYHNNGLIAAEGNMTNNVKSGLWTYYNYEGELEKIIRCNHKLRFYTRRFFHESRLGNPSKALNYLKKAIGISPLKALKKYEENFALHMRDDCFYAKRLDCSLKYAKIWVNQVIQSSQFNNKEKANAHEILGFLYWQKSQKGKGEMNPGEIIKLIDNSIEAFKKGIEYYRISTAAHGYLDILYTGKADLDPQNREKYLALAQKNRKTFAILLQKVKVKNQQETERFLESLDEMKPKKVSRDKPATEESINAYQILEDDLWDLLGETVMPPPMPIPPPPLSKDKYLQRSIEKKAIRIRRNPRLIKRVNPVYPSEALSSKIEGRVLLDVITDVKGRVAKIRVIDGDEILSKSAMDAVIQWVFEPYKVKGKARPIRFTVVLNFELPKE